jgi:hypothetical protein
MKYHYIIWIMQLNEITFILCNIQEKINYHMYGLNLEGLLFKTIKEIKTSISFCAIELSAELSQVNLNLSDFAQGSINCCQVLFLLLLLLQLRTGWHESVLMFRSFKIILPSTSILACLQIVGISLLRILYFSIIWCEQFIIGCHHKSCINFIYYFTCSGSLEELG